MLRILSLLMLFIAWQVGAEFADPRHLPSPILVFMSMGREAASGQLFLHLSVTLLRVVAAFILAMSIGSAIGMAMGQSPLLNRLADPWLILLLNLPALVIIVLAYIWVGLNETAAIGAVALNKIPNAIVTLREGMRARDAGLDEMAQVYRFSWSARLRHVLFPQLAPFFAASARAGLSLVWKIVLVVEMLGRANGIGFQINVAFQLFDVTLLLAYALPFVVIMLMIETFVVQPIEKHTSRWRPLHA
jgi:NitT/TauT family transport system permease protein